ncbi:MAG: hypothetical protein A4S17_02270 [Proteobacteria bacterium HN_bin10]|nr:MAG: hypothetical protein A4S17_02270 [Proteobacteria bacterium HN_bin10]
MSTLDKKRATELIKKVQSVLWNDWDPIGVRQIEDAEDWPTDEYDNYAPKIAGMIWHERSVAEIADYLDWATNEQMGLSGDLVKVRQTHELLAKRLLALKSEIA